MKKYCILFFFIFSVALSAQTTNKNYDENLAKELKADDYGMKSYFLVILKTGSNQSTDKNLIAEKFKGHMENINRLVKDKKLVVAGPMGKNEKNYRGIFIFQDVASMEEMQHILQTDPAVEAKFLDVEIYNWYGSAALPVYLDTSDKIWKENP
ncbi:YciI family protein [Empedobacter brevis]|uniref:YciI family protein n=1 Tax=Empedobacter brevis TaxID=247 RepID=UPI00289F3187|nr:YciI family protein [Empedobacter brevis]